MSFTSFAKNLPPIEKGVSQELAKWRAKNYSDVRYKLNLTIEKKAPTLKGTIEISLKSKVKKIILDWRKIKGHEHLSKVSNVSINGKKLVKNPQQPSPPRIQPPMYEHYNEHLIFDEGVNIGENTIKLDFESPILTSGSAITRYIDKEDGSEYIYSLFVPSDASTAFPVFDQPDLKARFSLAIKKSWDWKVISNSLPNKIQQLPTSHSEDAKKKLYETTFEETKPISTYVFAFAVGEFEEFDKQGRNATVKERVNANQDSNSIKNTLPNGRVSATRVYVRKSQAEKFKPHAEEVFRLNRESIKYFEDYFDYKFPFPKYDLVLIPEFPFGGMEHAGATFLRESSIIFPTEPTANNYISRASLLLHENAHQWFGDTVTMKWFDDLWLKEGFATFMAYKAMEKVLPQYDVWKVFYERTKQRAYLTDVTKGTTPIYQEIPNLNSAKSVYGNIVYQKAPSFLKQAEFYLGEKEFQAAVRSFLKNHEFANAEWSDLVASFEKASNKDLELWADVWVKKRGLPIIRIEKSNYHSYRKMGQPHDTAVNYSFNQNDVLGEGGSWLMKTNVYMKFANGTSEVREVNITKNQRVSKWGFARFWTDFVNNPNFKPNLPTFIFPNYRDNAYGIFLLDEKSKKYILENIQNEKDDFLRSMMWGSLWDSVRFAELDPKDYVELAIKNIEVEKDVTTISSILGRVNTAMTYYIPESGNATVKERVKAKQYSSSTENTLPDGRVSAHSELASNLENRLIGKMKSAATLEQRITFYRSFINVASSAKARSILKDILNGKYKIKGFKPRTRDKFNIVTRLIILGDKDAPKLLEELEKIEKGDVAKRYAYAAKAGFATKENKAKYWNDFVNNKEISESWIEAAFDVWNAPSHSELTLPYLEKALAELPNHKQNRKIFFVNGWTASFIGGHKSKEALDKVNKFLKEHPNLDIDLQRKILERLDGLERAVKIREKFSSKG